MNILNVKISFFKNCYAGTEPINGGTFYDVITSEKLAKQYGPLLDWIRAEPDKIKRKALKEQLPVFTPSGMFSERNEKGLISHSGLLSFDLDSDGNPFLNAGTVEAVKAELSKLPVVAFIQVSASGTGLWGVIPIAYPDRHKEQFEALETAFTGFGYKLDKGCSDVCRARFWSYDPAPYINLEARKFTGLPKPKPERPAFIRESARPDDLAMQAAEYLIKNRVSLECTYANFMRIAFACKNEWGENGKDIALDILHSCSTFPQSNTARNFDTHWRNAKRESGNVVTAGSLVLLAKEAGFKYRNQERPTTAPQPPTMPQVTPPVFVPDYSHEHHTDQNKGQSNEVLLNADGYPAEWDIQPTQNESLVHSMKANPEVRELIKRFDLKFEGIEPITDESEKVWLKLKERANAIVSRAKSKGHKYKA